ncbi:metallophosphoesterase [Hansschlegelia beijingensis]
MSSIVNYAFVEPYEDACAGALVTWVSDSVLTTVLEYSEEGANAWRAAFAHRIREFPEKPGVWLHTAKISTLGADTVYKFRFPGAEFSDRFKTPPSSGVRVAIASDYHKDTYGDGSNLDLFGKQFVSLECDLLILNGDYIIDDGIWSPETGQRWFDFMRNVAIRWRRARCLVPIAATLGNHEGANKAGTSNAEAAGNGSPGPIIEIFSLGYDPDDIQYENRSMWSFRVGAEVAFIGYETSHTVYIEDQIGWLTAVFDRLAPLVRHINLCGHAGAFFARSGAWERARPNQAPKIKKLVWPILEAHALKMRAYWVGHEHNIGVTARLRMEWDESLPATKNADRWLTDPVRGVRQLGSGALGGVVSAPLSRYPREVDRVSTIDASPKFIAALAYTPSTGFEAYGNLTYEGAAAEHFNMWVADYSERAFVARCVDANGHVFYTLEEAP